MIVQPYDAEWPHRFHQLQGFLYRNLAGTYHAVEHFGGTAVPGMAARPIIDAGVVPRDGQFGQVRDRLVAAGYEQLAGQGVESFRLRDAGLLKALPAHHVSVLAEGSEELRRHRAFRDYLIAHPEQAVRLSAGKLALASRLGDDDAAYQAAKEPLVLEILALALAPREAPA